MDGWDNLYVPLFLHIPQEESDEESDDDEFDEDDSEDEEDSEDESEEEEEEVKPPPKKTHVSRKNLTSSERGKGGSQNIQRTHMTFWRVHLVTSIKLLSYLSWLHLMPMNVSWLFTLSCCYEKH